MKWVADSEMVAFTISDHLFTSMKHFEIFSVPTIHTYFVFVHWNLLRVNDYVLNVSVNFYTKITNWFIT